MKMRTYILMLMLLMPMALAQGEVDAGVLPNSPLWKADILWEKTIVFLTPGTQGKINREIRNADERVSELESLGLNVDKEIVEKVEKERQRSISNAKSLAGKISDVAKKQLVDQVIELAQSRHLDVLQQVKDKVSGQAKDSLEMAIEKSKPRPVVNMNG